MHFAIKELRKILSVLIPEGSTVLYGPDHSKSLVESLNPALSAEIEDKPEFLPTHVVMLSLTDEMEDIYTELRALHKLLTPSSRVCVVTTSKLWNRLSSRFYDLEHPRRQSNWIPPSEVTNMFEQTGFEIVENRKAVTIPFFFPLVSRVVNRWLSQLPIIRHLSVFNITTIRPLLRKIDQDPSVSIIVAARNEAGNIRDLIVRLPILASKQELIFIEGGSTDSTWDTIQSSIVEFSSSPNLTISAFKQTGKGKGDAVRLGFSEASGDILIILDADLSVPPEELPRFIECLKRDKCEFANGSRLVYPMEERAMQFLNLIGNRIFGVIFSFLIGQPIRDTLCGTKALWAEDYKRLYSQRDYFGNFDPFGDFDLLFGASRLGLRIRDVPVHYKERVYGSTNISRFSHGVLLLKMTLFAARRLRFLK